MGDEISEVEQVLTHQPALSFSISLQHPFNRAGGRTSNVRQIMRTQASKAQLSQFGEFSVAAELNRRGFSATVTYGNMKNTDVVAFSQHGHYAIVEVKTSTTSGFVTGITPQKAQTTHDNVFWVLISARQDREAAKPRFFILSDAEIKKVQMDSDKIYLDRYSARNGKQFTGKGVPSFSMKKVENFEGRWEKIDAFLEKPKLG